LRLSGGGIVLAIKKSYHDFASIFLIRLITLKRFLKNKAIIQQSMTRKKKQQNIARGRSFCVDVLST
tara:strand:+ start:312 stop:512 length:201 start_codon:yes stop_codon:yes gene_type:complete